MTHSSSPPSPRHCPKCRVAADPTDHFCRGRGADLTHVVETTAAPRDAASHVPSHGSSQAASEGGSHAAPHSGSHDAKSTPRPRPHAKPSSDEAIEITSFEPLASPHAVKRGARRWIVGGSVVAVVAAIAVVLGVRRSGPPDAPRRS